MSPVTSSDCNHAMEAWQAAEDSRVTYEIDPNQWEPESEFSSKMRYPTAPGTIVLGQIINGKLHII